MDQSLHNPSSMRTQRFPLARRTDDASASKRTRDRGIAGGLAARRTPDGGRLAWLAGVGSLVLAAPTFLLAAPVLAQSSGSAACSQGVTVELLSIGEDEDITGTDSRDPNRAECDAEAALRFQLTMLPQEDNLVVYVGDEGSNCENEESRDPNLGTDECDLVGSLTLGNEMRFVVDVGLDDKLCTSGQQTVRRLYFFPAAGSDITDSVDTFGCYDLTVDASPPAAPTDLNAPQGENVLTLTWETVTDQTIQSYVAFYDDRSDPEGTVDDFDAGAGDGNGDCPSSVIVEGAILDRLNLPTGIGSSSVTGQVASSVDIGTGGLGSEVLPVAVAALDQAGNLGPLSEVTCMRIVETDGYWDAVEAAGAGDQAGCACGVGRGGDWAGASSAVAPIGLALLGLSLRARRRRS